MKRLIIITGDLCSGKSTLAEALSSQLSIANLTKDHMKELITDCVGYSNRQENRNLSIAAVNSMLYVFEEMAKVGDDLILEGNFRSEEMERMKEICEENSYSACLLFLTGDFDVLYSRFVERQPTRHKAHLMQGLETSKENYVTYVTELRNQEFCFKKNVIDMTTLDKDDVAGKALDILSIEGFVN